MLNKFLWSPFKKWGANEPSGRIPFVSLDFTFAVRNSLYKCGRNLSITSDIIAHGDFSADFLRNLYFKSLFRDSAPLFVLTFLSRSLSLNARAQRSGQDNHHWLMYSR